MTSPQPPALSLAQIVERMRADAAAGVHMAHSALASLAAAGIGLPQDWRAALGRLAQAAQLGSATAEGQLQALADLAPERTPPSPPTATAETFSASPHIRALRGFLPASACAWLIGLAQGRVAPARIYGQSAGGEVAAGRSNSAFEIGLLNADVVVHAVRARIAAALSVDVRRLENTQVLHYAPEQQFAPHVDYLDDAHPDVVARGQRALTFLVYLNDAYAGGETAFPRLGLAFKGAPGDALAFDNVDADGRGDPRTLHTGTAPLSGEKWLLSQWVRTRPTPPPQ